MSTELFVIKGADRDTTGTRFACDRKTCIQITQGIGSQTEPGFIQLTKEEAAALIHNLVAWVVED